MMCRRWRAVPQHLYGRTRLTCTRVRGHWETYGPIRHHNQPTGWSWYEGELGHREPPRRDWTCSGIGDDGAPHGVTLEDASYDSARTRGWRINLHHGQIDAMCPDCARPDPVTVGLCRDLEKSVRR